MRISRLIASVCAILSVSGCASIQPVGTLGPKQLGVYSISQNDFLSASRMLVILDKNGNVKAYSGGTVSGLGTLGIETGGTVLTAGAAVYAGKAIQKGLTSSPSQHTWHTVK